MFKDKGVMLVPRNLVLPTARFLTQEEQEAYQDAINQYSGKARETLNVPLHGTNIFKVCLLNQAVLPEGVRTATLADLGQIVETDKDYLRGVYVDSNAVVLRSAGDSYSPNDYLAKSLAKQIRKRTFKNPVIVTGLGLEVEAFNGSAYGLSFRRTDKTKVIDAPELHDLNSGRRFTKTDERGMPIFDKNGNRTLYTRNNGLSRLYLNRVSYLDSDNRGLVGSYSGGRVVVVDARGVARENLEVLRKQTEELLARQKKEKEDLIARLKG